MKQNQVLKCADCALTLEVLTPCDCGSGRVTCCGKSCVPLAVKTADAGREKHVPYLPLGQPKSGMVVQIGSVPHPMTEEHRIDWIEVIDGDTVTRKYLHPGEKPEAAFPFGPKSGMTVREYCNLHGLWEYEIE